MSRMYVRGRDSRCQWQMHIQRCRGRPWVSLRMQVNAAAEELAQLGRKGNGSCSSTHHNSLRGQVFGTDQLADGLSPTAASAAVCRAVTCSIEKLSIASLNNR